MENGNPEPESRDVDPESAPHHPRYPSATIGVRDSFTGAPSHRSLTSPRGVSTPGQIASIWLRLLGVPFPRRTYSLSRRRRGSARPARRGGRAACALTFFDGLGVLFACRSARSFGFLLFGTAAPSV
jgi:hypothetical protein